MRMTWMSLSIFQVVFPKFWRSLGQLFGVNSYTNPSCCEKDLVTRHCCDPCRATQGRAHNVAANSHNLEMSRGCRATSPIPPKKGLCRTDLATPLSLCRGRSSLQKRIALHGGVATALTPIALHCATKEEEGEARIV